MNYRTTLKRLAVMAGLLSVTGAFAQSARLQVIHNAADLAAAQVDVYVNGGLFIDNFAFRTATPFQSVPSGVDLNIGIAPANSTSASQAIATFTYNLEANQTYILVAAGIVSPSGYSPNIGFDLYAAGGRESAQGPGTDVLVFHGSTDAPQVQVAETAVLGGAVVVPPFSFGEFAGYLEVPTADFVLEVQLPNGTPVVAYQAPLSTLNLNGAALTVLASGFLNPAANSNGPAFGLYVALPSGGALVPLPVAQQPTGTARLQVIHNSADLAASVVDVYVNGDLFINDFAFRTATPFQSVPSGVDLEIGIAPGNSTSANDAIATFTYNLEADETYILVAAGIVSGSGYSPNIAFDLYATGGRESAQGTGTDVLVFHGSTDAPQVQVAETAVLGGAVIVPPFSFGEFAGYLEVPTADFVLEVQLPNGTPVVAYQAPLATLNLQGAALTVLASGFLNPAANSNGPAFGLFVALPSGGALVPLPVAQQPTGTARLQVIHNSADLAASVVDVYVNGDLFINDFAFRTATPFQSVPSGVDLEIGIAPANSTSASQSIATFTYNLEADETYILVAAGIVSASGYSPNIAFDLYATGGRESAQGTGTDVLVFHGSTDAPQVQVAETAVLGGAVIVPPFSFGEFAGYLEVPTADFVLEVQLPNGTPVVAYQAPLATLNLQGAALTVLASGFLNPAANSNGPAFGLFVALPSGGALVPLPVAQQPTGTARLQVIHNSADAAAAVVDVYVNGDLFINDFAFRTATPFQSVPSGVDLEIGIAPANSTSASQSIATFTYNLEADETYILVAAGIVSASGYSPNIAFDLYAAGGRESAQGPGTDVLVFHGSTDAPQVQVAETAILGGAVIVPPFSFGEFAGYLEVPTENFVLQVQLPDGTPVIAYQAPLSTLNLQGAALTVLASGFLNPAANSNGPGFGLYVALPSGGALIALPVATGLTENGSLLNNMTVWPNPTNDRFFIDMNSKASGQATLQLTDLAGRVVRTAALTLATGESRVELPVDGIANGSYLLSILNGDAVRTVSVQIAR